MSATWAIVALLVGLSAWAGVVDGQSRRIPNTCCGCVAACGLALQLARMGSGAFPLLGEPLTCVCVAVVVAFLGTGVELAYRWARGHAGLGFGDIKYVSAWAVTLGWLVFPALAAACLLGAIWGLATRQRTFALGPWLSLAFAGVVVAVCFL